jgi:uncharacterized protein
MADSQETLLRFPCSFPIKVMGERVDGFADTVCALVKTHAPDFDPATVEMRPSRQGNYLGLTLVVRAESKAQLDAIYHALTRHPMVKVAL